MKTAAQAVTTMTLTKDGITITVDISRGALGQVPAVATAEVEDMSRTVEEDVDEELIEAKVSAYTNIQR